MAPLTAERCLPAGWRWVRLGEVCDIEMGQSPPGDSYSATRNGEPLLNGPSEFGEKHPVAVQWTTAPTKFAQEGDIEKFEIPLPPLAEQQRIAAILREQMVAVEQTRAAAEAELAAINALPAALLRRAFNGEI